MDGKLKRHLQSQSFFVSLIAFILLIAIMRVPVRKKQFADRFVRCLSLSHVDFALILYAEKAGQASTST